VKVVRCTDICGIARITENCESSSTYGALLGKMWNYMYRMLSLLAIGKMHMFVCEYNLETGRYSIYICINAQHRLSSVE
jgi:hypothetical protein